MWCDNGWYWDSGAQRKEQLLGGKVRGKEIINLREGFAENVTDETSHESEAEICRQRNCVCMCVSFKEKGLVN